MWVSATPTAHPIPDGPVGEGCRLENRRYVPPTFQSARGREEAGVLLTTDVADDTDVAGMACIRAISAIRGWQPPLGGADFSAVEG